MHCSCSGDAVHPLCVVLSLYIVCLLFELHPSFYFNRTTEIDSDGECKVVAIKNHACTDFIVILQDVAGNSTERRLSSARNTHPQTLIDFFVSRIQFREKSKQVSA